MDHLSNAKIKAWAAESMAVLHTPFLQDLYSQWTTNRETIVSALAKSSVVCDNGIQQVTFFSVDYVVELMSAYEASLLLEAAPPRRPLKFEPIESIESRLRKFVEGSCDERSQVALVELEFFSQEEIEAKYESKVVKGIGCFVAVYVIPEVGNRLQTNYRKDFAEYICERGKSVCLVEVCDGNVRICTLDLNQIPQFLIKSFTPVRFDNFEWHEGCVKFVGMNDPDSNDNAMGECNEDCI